VLSMLIVILRHQFLHACQGSQLIHGYLVTYVLLWIAFLSLLQVIILDVRVPCTPVARLNNHRACVNGIAWAPHSSCHICTAGMLICHTNEKVRKLYAKFMLGFHKAVCYDSSTSLLWLSHPPSPVKMEAWKIINLCDTWRVWSSGI
jgi:hypothetical protein